jgi:hypothetical protein
VAVENNGSGCGTVLALVIGAVVLYQCHKSGEEHAQAIADDKVLERTAEIQSGTYQDTYGDEGCTSDCSGHEAGFKWAREHNITSEGDCSSYGDTEGSFAQGCKAYVQAEEQAEQDVEEDQKRDN